MNEGRNVLQGYFLQKYNIYGNAHVQYNGFCKVFTERSTFTITIGPPTLASPLVIQPQLHDGGSCDTFKVQSSL